MFLSPRCFAGMADSLSKYSIDTDGPNKVHAGPHTLEYDTRRRLVTFTFPSNTVEMKVSIKTMDGDGYLTLREDSVTARYFPWSPKHRPEEALVAQARARYTNLTAHHKSLSESPIWATTTPRVRQPMSTEPEALMNLLICPTPAMTQKHPQAPPPSHQTRPRFGSEPERQLHTPENQPEQQPLLPMMRTRKTTRGASLSTLAACAAPG